MSQQLTDEQMGELIAKAVTNGLGENVKAAVEETVNAKFKEMDLDSADGKFKVNADAKSLPGLSDAHASDRKGSQSAKFIKAVFKKDYAAIASTKGLSEGIDSEGGFLVPEEMATELDRIAENVGLIRKLSRRIPMTRETMNMPVLGNAATVTWDGEAVSGSDTSPTFANVKLIAKKATGLAPVTNELLEDSNVEVNSMLMELFGEALATAEDTQGLIGTGSPFTGILNNPLVSVTTMGSTKTAFTDVTLANLRDMISQIKMTALPGSVWVMSPTVFGTIQKIQENNQSIVTFQNPIVPNTVNGGLLVPAGYIWGYPVYVSEVMPAVSATAISTKFIIFGNFKYFYFGDRKSMAFDISQHATVGSVNAFASNQSIVRVVERVGMAVGIGGGFSVLKTAAA